MAHNSPNTPGRTKYGITNTALDRLREKSESANHVDDYGARKLLDDALTKAMDLPGCIEAVVDDRGQAAKLVDLTGTADGLLLQGELFALVKGDEKEDGREIVVTVIGDKAATAIRRKTRVIAEGKAGEPFNPALASLGRLKATLDREVHLQPVPSAPQAKPAAERPPVDEQYAVLTFSEFEVMMERTAVREELTRAEAVEFLRERARNGHAGDRLYRRVPVKVTVEVEVGDE